MTRNRIERGDAPDSRTWSVSRRAFLASGAATAAAVAGCLGDSESTTAVTYRHRFVREGLDPAVNDGGVEMGLWEEEGLDVSFKTSQGSQAATTSVAQGNDEFGNGEIAAVLGQIQAGSPLTIIGQILAPLPAVVSLGSKEITAWEDLEGRTVAKYPFGVVGPLAKGAYQEVTGDPPDEVTWQNMQPGTAGQLVMEEEVDAVVTYFPQIVARLRYNGHETNVLKIADVYDYLGVSLYTRDEVIEDDPEMVDSFVRGWLRAHKAFVTDLDTMVAATSEEQEAFNEDIQLETLGEQYASRVPPKEIGLEYGKGWTPRDRLENTQEVFTELGILDESRPVEEYYTNRFIEQNQELAVDTAEVYYEELEENHDVGPDYV